MNNEASPPSTRRSACSAISSRPTESSPPPELTQQVGIGTRVRVVYVDVGDGFAIPQWTVDENADQPTPWRYDDGHGHGP